MMSKGGHGIFAAAGILFALCGLGRGEARAADSPPGKGPDASKRDKDPLDFEARSWINGDAPTPEQLKGRIVILHFFHPFCEASSTPSMVLSKIHAESGERGIVVLGVAPEVMDAKMAEEFAKKRSIPYPIALAGEAFRKFKIHGWPSVKILDPDGKGAWEWQGPDDLETMWEIGPMLKALQAAVTEVCGKTPPHGGIDREKLRGDLAKAGDLLSAGDAAGAARVLRAAAREDVPFVPECREARTRLGEAETKGAERLEACLARLDSKDYAGISKDLAEIEEAFSGLELGKRAAAERQKIEEFPEVKAAREAAAKAAEAEQSLAEALLLKKEGKLREAYEGLRRCAETFPGTEAGTQAAARAEEIRKDPVKWAAVEEATIGQEARRLLSLGRTYLKARNKEKAKKNFDEVRTRFPGTSYAREAEEGMSQVEAMAAEKK